jgi:RNA polymerase sigma factor (sigma-70 family)
MDDQDLLEQFRLTRPNATAEQAFAELVRRHAGFVLATCRRRLRDAHLSEDAAQAVFLVLARRPPVRTATHASIAGWLYTTAIYACNNAMQARRTRQMHEQRAAAEALRSSNSRDAAKSPTDAEVLLDQALANLSSKERDAVLLRYYQDQGVQEVGAALGISQNTATKRIGRAIERMREFLAGNGLALAAPALVEAITQATRVPLPSAEFVARAVSIATGQSLAPLVVQQLAEGVNHMIRIAKLKLVAGVATIVIGASGLIAMNQLFARPADQKPATAPAAVATTQHAPANTPKQALKEFAAAVRKGDASKLAGMSVAETDDERELVKAASAYVDATGAFSKAVEDKFGAAAKKELATLFELTPVGRFAMFIETTVDEAPEVIDGNVASIQPPGVDDLTFWLVNVDGQWKLATGRMCERWTPDEWRDRIGLMNMAAGALQHFTEGVASGKYTSMAELKRDIAPALRQNR